MSVWGWRGVAGSLEGLQGLFCFGGLLVFAAVDCCQAGHGGEGVFASAARTSVGSTYVSIDKVNLSMLWDMPMKRRGIARATKVSFDTPIFEPISLFSCYV